MSPPFDRPTGSSSFPTTIWSIIASARDPESKSSRESLARLCTSYWHPVYAFVRHKGFDAEEARDCTQEFFARVIEKQYLADVDRSKGRFRSFLLAAVSHFLSNYRDARRAQKRGGGEHPIPLEDEDANGRHRHDPAHASTPEALFEYHWALTLLDRALERLRAGYTQADFLRLKPFLLGEAAHGELAATAQQLGASEGALKVAVHRMRRRYRDALRSEILETVSEPSQVDSEIRYLMEVLARGRGSHQVV
jgi:RNA polymerase sigma factor (sigma-70 family)